VLHRVELRAQPQALGHRAVLGARGVIRAAAQELNNFGFNRVECLVTDLIRLYHTRTDLHFEDSLKTAK